MSSRVLFSWFPVEEEQKTLLVGVFSVFYYYARLDLTVPSEERTRLRAPGGSDALRRAGGPDSEEAPQAPCFRASSSCGVPSPCAGTR